MTGEGGVGLFGRSLTGRKLRRRVGRLDQVAGIEPIWLDPGEVRRSRLEIEVSAPS